MTIADDEITTICRPIGRPVATSARRMARSGHSNASCSLCSSRKWRRRYSTAIIATRLTNWAISVASAEPAMPSAGNGRTPKISTGFSTTSSTTDSSMK
ncbi:hypothetical protein D3C71_1614760 [compost metagenome]